MAEISMRVLSQAFKADSLAIDRQANRATMWGLREIGRELKRAEKSRIPVYKGPGAQKRSTKKRPVDNSGNRPISGLLKASVGSARSFKRLGPSEYVLVVGPRGGRVNLYKGKIEAKYHYAKEAYDEVTPRAPLIMAAGWERALRRGR